MEVIILTKDMFLLEMKHRSPFLKKEEAEKRWRKSSKGFNFVFKFTKGKMIFYESVLYLNEYVSK